MKMKFLEIFVLSFVFGSVLSKFYLIETEGKNANDKISSSYGRPTRVSTAGHLNRGLQFRSAAKRRKSVKGKKKNRSGSKNRNIGLVKSGGLTLKEGNFLDGLRDNLGLPKSKGLNRNRAKKFGSSLQETKAVKDDKTLKTATINNLLIRDKNKEFIKTCKSESLKKFQETRVQSNSSSTKKEEDSDCSVKLPDYKAGEKSLEELNAKVMAAEYLKKFKKGVRASNFDPAFKTAAKKFAGEFLLHGKYEDLVARMEFFKEHPGVNEEILEYAFVEAQVRRTDLALCPPNPIEIDDRLQNGKKKENGNRDYTLYINTTNEHYHVNESTLSNDPEDQKWDHYREDTLFHGFHVLLHQIHSARSPRTPPSIGVPPESPPRLWEIFWYAHQQQIRRALVERKVEGLPDLTMLSPEEFKKPLGPGYKEGWFTNGLSGRIDNCDVSEAIKRCNTSEDRRSCTDGGNIEGNNVVVRYEEVQNALEQEDNHENFMAILGIYHNTGHMLVGLHCRSKPDEDPSNSTGPMGFDVMSARDPIFYRWHGHLEDLNQQFRDTKLPKYNISDFQLTQGVRVVNAKTVLENPVLGSLDNILLTHMEDTTLDYGHNTQIHYRRVNHHRFKYVIELENPERTNKKVIVRLFLGINQIHLARNYDRKWMIEMDRFVHNLQGNESEVIERESVQSAATMKEQGSSLIDLMRELNTTVQQNQQNQEDTIGTWVGFPHNMLVPRGKAWIGERLSDREGFVLMAFVNDVVGDNVHNVQNIVQEGVGADKEHMMIGPRSYDVRNGYSGFDNRPFGFPFDRDIDFVLNPADHSFFGVNIVQILFNEQNYDERTLDTLLREQNAGGTELDEETLVRVMQQLEDETSTTEASATEPSGVQQHGAIVPQSNPVEPEPVVNNFVPQVKTLFDSVVNPALQAVGSVLGG